MNCMNCGAFLVDKDLDYCPKCGCNVLIQKKVDYLSRQYYNRGLEKASVRDLSGAIDCLKQSLIYNKHNIQARNLLGLVYFETGEVVAALSEWVISKNLQPSRNLASEYINKLQANSNKLEAINETIRKYNDALNLCREGHEDMAAIRLKKILIQNPKLIKGYHLLALVQMWTAVRMIWQSRFLSIKKKEGFRCFLHWLPDFVQDCWRFIFWLFLPYVRESTGKRISRL